ncbi:MAG: hypothetical protein ACRDCT_28405 [Shewanella sp.]
MNPFLDEIEDDEPEEVAEADPAASGFSRMKCDLRAEIEQHVSDFLARGGEIEKLEFGMRRTLDYSYTPGDASISDALFRK